MRDEYDPKSKHRFWYDADGKLILVCPPGTLAFLTTFQQDWRNGARN